jgi:aryl-alcohol dehydrogenase-like predicted oxidoreductase
MYAWQFCKALYLTRQHNWTRFITMQNHLNLLYREEEREMMGLCVEEGIGVLPWSPLARGRLARQWGHKDTTRAANDSVGETLYAATEEADRRVVQAVEKIAQAREVPLAQVALAWLLQKPGVTAPVVGVSKPRHLDDALAALDTELTGDEVALLEAPYVPHRVAGFV